MLKLKVDKNNCVLCPNYDSNNIDVNINYCNGVYEKDVIWERCKHFVFFDFIRGNKCDYVFHVICRYDMDTESREQKIEKATKIIEDHIIEYSVDSNIDPAFLAKELLVKMGII